MSDLVIIADGLPTPIANGPVVGSFEGANIFHYVDCTDGQRYYFSGTLAPNENYCDVDGSEIVFDPGIIYRPKPVKTFGPLIEDRCGEKIYEFVDCNDGIRYYHNGEFASTDQANESGFDGSELVLAAGAVYRQYLKNN